MPRDAYAATNLSRRGFLQSAVMGAAAAALAMKLRESGGAVAAEDEDVEIVSGVLLGQAEGWMEIAQEGTPRRLPFHPGTSFWKGGETGLSALSKGDDIMARIATPSGRALRVWSNLDRGQGLVTNITPSGYVLRTTGLHAQGVELFVQVTEATLLAAGDGSPLALDARMIEPDDHLDVIGESIADGLRATLIWPIKGKLAALPEPQMPAASAAADSPVEPLALCTFYYRGYAEWFNCPTGAGRCSTCSTSSSYQTAWPALDSCGCCSRTCCDCSKGCKNQIPLSCGAQVRVYDACSSKVRTCTVVDCGPCQKANCAGCSPDLCSRTCSACGRTDASPVVDLTRPTFAYLYDPASRGCFPWIARYDTIC